MLGSASKISAARPLRQSLDWGACPSRSRVRDAGGTAKVPADWASVSGVSPVSPGLKLIDRTQEKARQGISWRSAACAETGETRASAPDLCGETTGARHR